VRQSPGALKNGLVAGAGGVTVLAAMKMLPGKGKVSGLTLIELLVVIAVIVILAAMLLPTTGGPRRARAAICMNNQRQIAIALMMFQGDYAGQYPWQVSTTNNGSLELVANGLASDQFSTLAAYLGKQPHTLICPADKARQAATNFSTLTNTNISYFLNLDAATNMNSILTGERNLEFNWKPINPGIFSQTTNTMLKWIAGFHGGQDKPYGIISFADGHVQVIQQNYLNRTLQNQPFATNRFCFP
jgi:prepilin-type N-terminal cleavage/methylation domain-containing protein/prepilin-type processing-associated H-X9-DG protein